MYGDSTSSDAIAKDMNTLLDSSTFKHHPSDSEFAKIKDMISTNSYSNNNHYDHNNYNQHQNQNQNHQQSVLGEQNESSLMRYRSAPSSFYAHLLDEDDFLSSSLDNSSNNKPDERFFFGQEQEQQQQQQQQQFQTDNEFLQYVSSSSSMKPEPKEADIQKLDYPPHLPTINNNGIYNATNQNNLQNSSTFRSINSTSSNLIRQSSSPAGFLSSLDAETGFAGMRDVKKTSSSSRLNNQINFSSGPSSSKTFLPHIAENSSEMNDSTVRSLKRNHNGDSITLDRQNGISYTPSLVHHMSLPKTSSEMATAEKFLRFEQDSVPCKIRAKRGCATHPRSIAERVRRTRISDRMKKLQELFPNMDKQTSTADMLDMSVQYIKNLQKDLQTLNNARAKCKCSSKQLETDPAI